ncbi:cation diffusion facilitator family transporter [Candidatus Latescibacterota bacterium]
MVQDQSNTSSNQQCQNNEAESIDDVHVTHDHNMDFSGISLNRLWIALLINFVFLIVEIVGGILSNSLALLADAGHMLTDVGALLLAIIVARLAESLPTPKRTFGLLRAEVLGAFINGSVLMVIVVIIFWEAWRRISQFPEINGPIMLVAAILGLFANAGSMLVLHGVRNKNVNIKGAYLHLLADTLGSIGAIVAGVIILFTGWTRVDQIASVFIGILILIGSWELLKQTINILLEATPENIDYEEVEKALKKVDHVKDIHDLHIWTITSNVPALSAHIELYSNCSDTTHWQSCLKNVQKMLRERFNIVHSTIQIEPEDFKRDSRFI